MSLYVRTCLIMTLVNTAMKYTAYLYQTLCGDMNRGRRGKKRVKEGDSRGHAHWKFPLSLPENEKRRKEKGKESKARPDAAEWVHGGGRLTGVQEKTSPTKSSKAALGVCHSSDHNQEPFTSLYFCSFTARRSPSRVSSSVQRRNLLSSDTGRATCRQVIRPTFHLCHCWVTMNPLSFYCRAKVLLRLQQLPVSGIERREWIKESKYVQTTQTCDTSEIQRRIGDS